MSPDQLAAQRFAMALELFEAGEAIMRQNLRRKFPDADEADIERRLGEWRSSRPGAPHGDAPGKPGGWPRQAP
jgi:hypothetical protein